MGKHKYEIERRRHRSRSDSRSRRGRSRSRSPERRKHKKSDRHGQLRMDLASHERKKVIRNQDFSLVELI